MRERENESSNFVSNSADRHCYSAAAAAVVVVVRHRKLVRWGR